MPRAAGAPDGIAGGGAVKTNVMEAARRTRELAVPAKEGLDGIEPSPLLLMGVQGGVTRKLRRGKPWLARKAE